MRYPHLVGGVFAIVVLATALPPTTATEATAPATVSPAASLVRQAMAAECQADQVARDGLLAQAVAADPDFAPARWQAGQVRFQDRWLSLDDALAAAGQDETLADYRRLRAKYRHNSKVPSTGAPQVNEDYTVNPVAELTMARWCQKHQLQAGTRAHATQLLTSRSDDPEVLKMLDLTWYQGQLITSAALAERKARQAKAAQAMQHWRPILKALRAQIEEDSPAQSQAALAELEAITDPDAIEAIIAVFGNQPQLACQAIRVIGQMPGQEATDALTQQALLAKQDEVLAAACQQLKTRSMFGYVPKLMTALSSPIHVKHAVIQGPTGVQFRETLVRTGEKKTIVKTLDTEVSFLVPNPSLDDIIGETYALTAFDTRRKNRSLAGINRQLAQVNESVYRVLDGTVGSMATHDPDAWWDWWHHYAVMQNGKPEKQVIRTAVRYKVDVPYAPTGPDDRPHYRRIGSCFARGTKVWTLDGAMPIEQIQTGDCTLSQNPLSGEIAFQPVLDVSRGRQEFLAIETAAGDRLVATPVHIFWISGAGWRLAKELQIGDRLHTLSGWSEIKSIEPSAADETFNLVVADWGTYFVGDERILTHDVTIPESVTGGVPGELAAD